MKHVQRTLSKKNIGEIQISIQDLVIAFRDLYCLGTACMLAGPFALEERGI
jgi:hypothetical protein